MLPEPSGCGGPIGGSSPGPKRRISPLISSPDCVTLMMISVPGSPNGSGPRHSPSGPEPDPSILLRTKSARSSPNWAVKMASEPSSDILPVIRASPSSGAVTPLRTTSKNPSINVPTMGMLPEPSGCGGPGGGGVWAAAVWRKATQMPVIAIQTAKLFANLNIFFPFLSLTSVNYAWRMQFVELRPVTCPHLCIHIQS